MVPKYEVQLRIDGNLIGNVRELCYGLTWVKRRTKAGVDEIDFTLNDVLFSKWCEARGVNISQMLKPLALDCRIVRDGVAVVGGFLATMPAYSPNGTSANLVMRFDGYMNYLAGVYIRPIGTVTGPLSTLIQQRVSAAETLATNAGKGFGITAGAIENLPTVEHTFDNYKTVKDWVAERCDNTTGAGPFDMIFNPDRTYDITADAHFGDVISDYTIRYPALQVGVSAASISAPEVGGYASTVIGIGAGEISSDASKNTAITSIQTNSDAVAEYGYAERTLQESSISAQQTLNNNTTAMLNNTSNPIWQPEITLLGKQVAPTPDGEKKIWIGDTVTIVNKEDLTGQTSGQFRVNELQVKVSATGAETIKPTLERAS